jgi:hypothetical protein
MKVELAFEFKEKVRVKTLGLEGYINAFWIQQDTVVQYQIEWLDERQVVNSRYFIENELERVI